MIPKFRAWHKKDKEMLDVQSLEWNRNKDLLYGSFWSGLSCPIERVILMLSTGRKDKNGTEIFEGDIVVHDSEKPPFSKACVITWDAPQFWWFGSPIRTGRPTQSISIVIGNIHENKELLDGQ